MFVYLQDTTVTSETLLNAREAPPYQNTLETTRTFMGVARLPSGLLLEQRAVAGTWTFRNSRSALLAQTSLGNTHI